MSLLWSQSLAITVAQESKFRQRRQVPRSTISASMVAFRPHPFWPGRALMTCEQDAWAPAAVAGAVIWTQQHDTARSPTVRRGIGAGESTVANAWLVSVVCVARQCSKSSCSELSTITLTFQYSRALAWIDDLTYERDPHSYDLCERHGQRMTVPTGWRLEDRRHRFRVVVPNRLAG